MIMYVGKTTVMRLNDSETMKVMAKEGKIQWMEKYRYVC